MTTDHERRDKLIRFGTGLQDETEARMSADSAYLKAHLHQIWGIGPSQDAARKQARLAFILENLFKDSCYEHGEMCQTKADCWSREIIAREPSWC